MIEESRVSRKVLSVLNVTFIALIPKKNNTKTFDDYRPISLCNFVYKIKAKILANRFKRICPDFISEEQCGLLHNRQIHHAV